MTSKSKFVQGILKWAAENPQDPVSSFIIENYAETSRAKRAEARKWRQIADALEEISHRRERWEIKEN